LGTCMYVHILTFLHFCLAPFWIFNMAAVNIDNETVREALGITGIILCAFGLLYGGFWRIQMRKGFNLLAYTFCFGEPAISDCTLWLCCCWCSLAQEVRAGNSYDIVKDKFCQKQMDCSNKMPHIHLSPAEMVQTQVLHLETTLAHPSLRYLILQARAHFQRGITRLVGTFLW